MTKGVYGKAIHTAPGCVGVNALARGTRVPSVEAREWRLGKLKETRRHLEFLLSMSTG